MNKDTMHKLANLLTECQDERKKLRETVERLQEQIVVQERRHTIALDTAYAAGFEAGKQEAERGIHR